MALTTCPECCQKISMLAKFCPLCGYPFAELASDNSATRSLHLKMDATPTEPYSIRPNTVSESTGLGPTETQQRIVGGKPLWVFVAAGLYLLAFLAVLFVPLVVGFGDFLAGLTLSDESA